MKSKISTDTKTSVNVEINAETEAKLNDKVAPKGIGCLDMVIAFDTTGSMAAYIDDVRAQVKDMIPRLFKDNSDLQLGIVAFGDYCDMENPSTFGNAYQCMPLTDNENDLISFVMHAKNTSGGDGDEFYELVLQKIIDEMPWREDSSKAILLIADASPHPVGYTYRNYVVGNQIDWREEARKAAAKMIKVDTVSICGDPWYNELSQMTNGICVPFRSSGKTAAMIETATTARTVISCTEQRKSRNIFEPTVRELSLRNKFCCMADINTDGEMDDVFKSYQSRIDEADAES